MAISHLAIGIDSQVTHHVLAIEKVAYNNIFFTKCSKCNTQVISDLVHDFMNFNALKNIFKIHKKITKKDPGMILKQGNLLVA